MSLKSQEILFDNDKLDYGIIKYDSDGYRDFIFTNIGDSPLLINNVIGQCGCTTTIENGVPGWPLNPIKPKQKGIIRVKYDTKRIGKFDKIITVMSNDKNGDKIIRIFGIVNEK